MKVRDLTYSIKLPSDSNFEFLPSWNLIVIRNIPKQIMLSKGSLILLIDKKNKIDMIDFIQNSMKAIPLKVLYEEDIQANHIVVRTRTKELKQKTPLINAKNILKEQNLILVENTELNNKNYIINYQQLSSSVKRSIRNYLKQMMKVFKIEFNEHGYFQEESFEKFKDNFGQKSLIELKDEINDLQKTFETQTELYQKRDLLMMNVLPHIKNT